MFDGLTDYNVEAEVAAPLLGDATVRGIRDQIRREMSIAVKDIDAPFSTLVTSASRCNSMASWR